MLTMKGFIRVEHVERVEESRMDEPRSHLERDSHKNDTHL